MHSQLKVLRPFSLALTALLLVSMPSVAEVNQRDLQVVARALGFLQPPLAGELRMGIVHAPANERSLRQAEAVAELLREAPRVGNVMFQPVLVPLADAGEARVDLFLLTEYLGAEARALVPVVERRRLPCVSTDVVQVRAGVCALGIQSAPKVQILANRQAAERSGLTFATVFRMMIVEL